MPTAAALRAGELGVSEYLEQTAARVATFDPIIQAFLPDPNRERWLKAQATALEARATGLHERPLLYGVAVGVKDCIRVDGFPTRAGSQLPPGLFDGPEASIVTALRNAGAVMLGKTAMDEFAYCEPAPTRNPHNLAHTPGGSSSGSAAAVAAGLCPLALGTQTSRSVIGPAAFCGVVGFKPSYGRIGTDGVVHLSPSFDTVGMLTQDVAGMALAATALIPNWQPVATEQLPVLGVPAGKLLTWTLKVGLQAFEEQLSQLTAAGFEVRRVPFFTDDEIEEMDRRAMTLLHGEMARVHTEWFRHYPERYRPRTARAILRGQAITDDELAACRAHQQAFRAQVEARMKQAGVDLWVTPASAGPAPEGYDVTGWGGMTTVWSYAGMPCVTAPAGRDERGLPLGLQGVAALNCDERLLLSMGKLEAVFTPRETEAPSPSSGRGG